MDTSSGGDGNAGAFAGAIMASPRGYLMSGKIMLTATLVFFTIALIILFLYLYGRWYLMRRQLRGFVFAGTPTLTAASKALDPVVLKSLPVVIFAGKRGNEAIECAVCLSEVAAGEKVRILPRCEHCFHIECIDMWFGSHATCPLCRVQVEAELDPPAAKAGEMRSESRGEEAPSTSTSTSTARGGEEEMGTKSPRSAILVLRRILSRDLGSFGGGTVVEPDLERGERLGI